jgi:hypothetical protein
MASDGLIVEGVMTPAELQQCIQQAREKAKPVALHSLADRGGQRLAQLGGPFDFEFAERLVALVVDHLQHAMQAVALQNRDHQHLLGAVARPLVHFLEETERRMDALESFVVIDVAQIQHPPARSGVSGQTLRADRQLQVAAVLTFETMAVLSSFTA